jgi:replicative DNA helicase
LIGLELFITLITESGIGEGNALSGFASGDSSGSKGLSARGQDADLIILDEGAFISLEAIEGVVISILATRPTTRFIISSTPSGIANDYFENICIRRPDFAEFYVPTTKRPDWEIMAEQMAKEFGSSQEKYDREILAAFSPAGIGVYREDLVRLAQANYEYGQMRPSGAFVYTFGVDWNKEHGTEIVIVGTQKAEPHISYIVGVENIPKKENTSPRGISRIVELNQIWNPMWIYVDAGGGDGGQMLRYHGRSMVGKNILEARLKDIVKDFDFGSKLEIREHDGRKNKVFSKPFMVENSVKKFELGEVKYPREDLNLTRQLNNYIVARRQPSGVPIYGVKEEKWGDHTLDALNLALVAIRLELPSFQHAAISPLAIPIAYIPNKPDEQYDDKKSRLILPAAATGASRIARQIPKHHQSASPTSVVKYWGTEPSEETIEENYRRHGVPRRKVLKYGR